MIKSYAVIVDDALVNTVASSLSEDQILAGQPVGAQLVPTDRLYGLSEIYWDGERVLMRPERPGSGWIWDAGSSTWLDVMSSSARLGQAKAHALTCIDDLAGAARLRYITSVPGQAETYAKKEEQARQWAAAAFAGDAPSFIAAEAVALNVSGHAVAEEVIALADYWANVKGPQIEACRRKWKVAAGAAASTEGVQAIVESARLELDAL